MSIETQTVYSLQFGHVWTDDWLEYDTMEGYHDAEYIRQLMDRKQDHADRTREDGRMYRAVKQVTESEIVYQTKPKEQKSE